MADEDIEMVEGCLKNDRLCQKKLYEKFSPALLAVCRRYSNNETDAEDILIESFTNIFKNLHTFRRESSLFQWMKSVTVKNAVDFFRKNSKHSNNLPIEDEILPDIASEDTKIETKLDAAGILKVMEKMPEEWRVIFNLRIMEELSFKEIAEELNKNENTVRVYFLRGKTWLSEKLKNE